MQNALTNSGMSSHRELKGILLDLLPAKNFDSLKIPMYVCVTDLVDAQSVVKSKGGNLVDYVVASASIPGVFETENINGKI